MRSPVLLLSSLAAQGSLNAGFLRFGRIEVKNVSSKLRLLTKDTNDPLDGIYGNGHLTVRNGKVPSLKLNENVMKLLHFNDLGPVAQDPSSFSSISADLRLTNLRISSSEINFVGYGVDVQARALLP